MIKGPQLSTIAAFASLFKKAVKEFTKNDPLRMAGATAFFTTFALPPILIILIQVFGLLIAPQKIGDALFQNLEAIIGRASVQQVLDTLIGFRRLAQNWYVTVGGFIFLMFIATTLFKVIKSSLNQLWKIRPVKRMSVLRRLRMRGKSILVILFAGLLFIVGLLAEGAQAFLGQYLAHLSPRAAFFFNSALSYLISIVIVTLWFAVLFRFLPDGRPAWKVALVGGLFTSILFTVGKLIIRWLLTYSNINTLYGASGSIVLLLLFVFYSSFILYYGAMFTKVWAAHNHMPIKPLPHAMHYQLSQSDDDD